jgi:membrane protein implicated in regulation of membrane protease activity
MIWIAVFIIGILFEIFATTFVALCFSVGSVFGFIMLLVDAPVPAQILVFLVTTGLTIWLMKPVRDRYLTKSVVKTNIDAMIGEVGVVEEEVSNVEAKGAVKVNGLTYTARSINGETLEVGRIVIVVRIEGVKLFCQALD